MRIELRKCGNGVTIWRKNGKSHRENAPAIISFWGYKEYWEKDVYLGNSNK